MASSDLRCSEKMNRKSPDLWPEPLPGINQFSKSLSSVESSAPAIIPVKFKADLDLEDVKTVNNLGQVSVDQLLEKISQLQNDCYTIGLDEAKEISRGKFLQILKPEPKDNEWKFE